MKRKFYISCFLATCCGLGYSPFVPGTVGAVLGIAVYILVRANMVVCSAVTLVLAIVGFAIAGRAAEVLGRKDPKPIVIDELVGTLIAFYLVPQKFYYLAAAFLLFRIFDVFKPYPAGRAERLPGSRGIMLDDIVAGLYANLAVQIFARLLLCRAV